MKTAIAAMSRFSTVTWKQLEGLEVELLTFARRHAHILSVDAEFVRVCRDKTFIRWHEPMWNMLLGERDMLIVDLASWAKAFYRKGGFLQLLHGPDLKALNRDWPSADGGCDSHEQSLVAKLRGAAFERLFPGAESRRPSRQDVEALGGRLKDHFGPLLDDRDVHRAHKYEREKATAAWLTPADVTPHLRRCQQLLGDLRFVASNTQFGHPDPRPAPGEREAQDVVDLVLCGPINWIIHYGAGADTDPKRLSYWQRRDAYYERLHSAHEASGDLAAPFNDPFRVKETKP
jgi:hypothetical protein